MYIYKLALICAEKFAEGNVFYFLWQILRRARENEENLYEICGWFVILWRLKRKASHHCGTFLTANTKHTTSWLVCWRLKVFSQRNFSLLYFFFLLCVSRCCLCEEKLFFFASLIDWSFNAFFVALSLCF
jgi:hypothetical protein